MQVVVNDFIGSDKKMSEQIIGPSMEIQICATGQKMGIEN